MRHPVRSTTATKPPNGGRRTAGRLLTGVAATILVLTAQLVVALATAATAGAGVHDGTPESETGVSLDRARAEVARAERRLEDAQTNHETYRAQLDLLSAGSASTIDRLAEARELFRQRAVAAFVGGDRPDAVLSILGDEDLFDASARVNLIRNAAEQTDTAVRRYRRLKAATDPELGRIAEAVQRADQELTEANDAALAARAQERDAERRHDREREAQAVVLASTDDNTASTTTDATAPVPPPAGPKPTSPSNSGPPSTTAPTTTTQTTTAPPISAPTTPAGPAATTTVPPTTAPPTTAPPTTAPPTIAPPTTVPLGGPTAHQWYLLRMCESTNNYQAVNPSGKYRGAYQFDLKTWASLGPPGDPAAAAPAEQDRRAKLLYAQRGWKPWPECGRFLW